MFRYKCLLQYLSIDWKCYQISKFMYSKLGVVFLKIACICTHTHTHTHIYIYIYIYIYVPNLNIFLPPLEKYCFLNDLRL